MGPEGAPENTPKPTASTASRGHRWQWGGEQPCLPEEEGANFQELSMVGGRAQVGSMPSSKIHRALVFQRAQRMNK